jgi:MFS family permease
MGQTATDTEVLPLSSEARLWYAQVTSYQWLVLIVASAGWIFDIYENQIFVVTRAGMLSDLLHQSATSPAVKYYSDSINSLFLVGGAIGGVMFGVIADRFGRTRSMMLSILVYATFSAMTSLAQAVWQVSVLRFLVAVGTGGEWAVAAAFVSEVFPPRARAHASGIFHASSLLGVMAAGLAGTITGDNWRMAYLLGLGPALLVFAVRFCLHEPKRKTSAPPPDAGEIETGPAEPQTVPRDTAHFSDFWRNPIYRRRAILGLLLAGVGLAGYWGVASAGQDIAYDFLIRHGVAPDLARPRATFAYTVIQTIGGGIGLFAMGPLCAWLGRRPAFVFMQLAAVIATPIALFVPQTWMQLLLLLPVMGFFVQGMHAGYAVYFPELFPARLRATGAGLCFNGARLVAAPMLILAGSVKSHTNIRTAVTLLSLVYLIGVVVVLFMPETKDVAID